MAFPISGHASGVTTKREIVRNGRVYIEEELTCPDGSVSKAEYLKNSKFTFRGCSESTTTAPAKTTRARNGITTTRSKGNGMNLSFSHNQTKEEYDKSTQSRQMVLNAIKSCTSYENHFRHPMMTDFMVTTKVHGLSGSLCKFTQTMPNNGMQTCNFTEQQRAALGTGGSSALDRLMMDANTCQITGY